MAILKKKVNGELVTVSETWPVPIPIGGDPIVVEALTVTENGTVTAPSGKAYSPVTTNVPTGTARSASDVNVSGASVTVPAGLYSNPVTKSVASGTAGTPSASKGTVSNHSVQITPSVTNVTGYITGGTKSGTPVTVSASELVSGSETKTANGTYDVTNLASLVVNVQGSGSANVKSGTLTVASDVNTATSTKITDTTELGFTPKAFMLIRADAKATRYHLQQCTFATVGTTYYRTMTYRGSSSYTTSSNTYNWTSQTAGYLYFNGGNVYIRTSTSYYFGAGTWHWVAYTW